MGVLKLKFYWVGCDVVDKKIFNMSCLKFVLIKWCIKGEEIIYFMWVLLFVYLSLSIVFICNIDIVYLVIIKYIK